MTTLNEQIPNKQFGEAASENGLDIESKEKQLSFPKSIILIVGTEFAERFMITCMRAILVLYLSRELMYDEDTSSIIYHTFMVLLFFLGVFGAIISDSWLGKFKTIFYLSIGYIIGGLIMSLGSIPLLHLPAREITILGLVLIAVGAGGIKPCVTAFGADQFKLPAQKGQMPTYFSVFYFIVNMGSFLSAVITPILRNNVMCFDQENCFSLAFAVPTILMTISIAIFYIGKNMYIINPPSGNMVVLVSKCIGNAISARIKSPRNTKKDHWLDYAKGKFDQQLINDIKVLLRIIVLYMPLCVFGALFGQRGSRWTFQATRMNGNLGSFVIKPDQIQVINPFLILVLLPVANIVIYPILSKIGIRKPLQKLTLGGILAGVAFVISGIVELQLEKTYPVMPGPNESQLRFFNTHLCDFKFETDIPNHGNFILKSMNTFEEKYISVNNSEQFTYRISPDDSYNNSSNCPSFNGNFNLRSEAAMSYFIQSTNVIEYRDNPGKSRIGDPLMRLLINSYSQQEVFVKNINGFVRFSGNTNSRELIQLIPATYEIYIENVKISEIKLDQGSVLTALITQIGTNTFSVKYFEIAGANSMHILWMVPQYVIMTLAEIMYTVTGLAFSYSQAPESMKSAVQACWLLTVCFGNIIAIVVFGAKFFDSQAYEFFLFAGLMFVDMCIFMVMAWRYKGVPKKNDME